MATSAEEIGALFRETYRKFQGPRERLTQRFEQTDLKIERLSDPLGRQRNRLGDFVQEMVRS